MSENAYEVRSGHRVKDHGTDATSVYEVLVAPDAGSAAVLCAGHVSRHLDAWGRGGRRACWIVRALDGEVIVSAGMGIGRGSCLSREDALWVLGNLLTEKPEIHDRMIRIAADVNRKRVKAAFGATVTLIDPEVAR